MQAIGERNLASLDERFESFYAQWPAWSDVRGWLSRAGLEVTTARELDTGERRSSWVFLAHPSEALRQHFELAPEVLVLCAPWKAAQVNDIRRVEQIFKEELRVDQGFALVLTQEANVEGRFAATLPEARKYLFLSRDLREAATDPQAFLRGRLRDELGARRLFDHRRPATGPQFFGRAREFEALERDVYQGHCLGVYGLRKIGKTSLLRRVAAKFRERAQAGAAVMPIEIDLLAMDYKHRTLGDLVATLRRGADEEAVRTGLVGGRGAGDHHERVAQLTRAARTAGARLLVVVDEYEALLDGRFSLRDGLEFLTWMRGVAQTYPEHFSFILAGRNRRLLSPARVGRVDNPMYRFLREVPLGGLAEEECRAMVRRIGRRMALDFSPDSLDLIVRETGGHPALVRSFGDLIDQAVPLADRGPALVDRSLTEGVVASFAREVDSDMRELVPAAEDIEPRAVDLLRHLAHGAPWVGGDLEARIRDGLVRYGILHPDRARFRIGRFASWVRENYAPPAEAALG